MRNDKDADLEARVRAEEEEVRDVVRAGAPSSGSADHTVDSQAAPNLEQHDSIMDVNDASDQAKWEGILTQTRADLGGHPVADIRQALAQRVSDAQLPVPADELDRAATEIAATLDQSDHFDRGTDRGE